MVDARKIQECKNEAKKNKMEGWFAAYLMDTDKDERARGKTVTVARAWFHTAKKRYTMLDCPGHRNYVPNLVPAVAQADVAVLVISARGDEFEKGIGKDNNKSEHSHTGQTREHVIIARSLGVSRFVVVISKMDDSTCNWAESRFKKIKDKLSTFFKSLRISKNAVHFMPISGLSGAGINQPVPAKWYTGPTLCGHLDELPELRDGTAKALCLPVLDIFKDPEGNSQVVITKVEEGTANTGDVLYIHPGPGTCKVTSLSISTHAVPLNKAKRGENLWMTVSISSGADLRVGSVLSDQEAPMVCKEFLAECGIFALPDQVLFAPGLTGIMHIHTATVGFKVVRLMEKFDPSKGEMVKVPKTKQFVGVGVKVTCIIVLDSKVAATTFKQSSKLGRFVMRGGGMSFGSGRIIRIKPSN
eukprot:CAMPEP_0168519398 /NCGR_PEP_ID=MMETSP0405-20121227/7294_1 /TAXON_ID=498012 /ORGANISM="Trichosphaerium sp, Strain Am-I-7 wt" /LENGTH=414 /DNA_ID=CAMNT_0008539933 /DNA_START=266 /DNA_END=1510 /DNA_ORIENTATION=+